MTGSLEGLVSQSHNSTMHGCGECESDTVAPLVTSSHACCYAGEIIGRFERKGFQLKGLKLFQTPKAVAEEHYKDLAAKPFYPALVGYICSGPVVCMVCGRGAGGWDCMWLRQL